MTRSQRRLPSESMGIMDERASGQRAGRGAGPAHSKIVRSDISYMIMSIPGEGGIQGVLIETLPGSPFSGLAADPLAKILMLFL